MRLHLWFYDMLLDARKNLCKGVERGNLTTEEALKAYTDIILKTIDVAVAKESEAAGKIDVKIRACAEEYDRMMGRVIKRARQTSPEVGFHSFDMEE